MKGKTEHLEGITPKERQFVEEYLTNGNATEAYMKVYNYIPKQIPKKATQKEIEEIQDYNRKLRARAGRESSLLKKKQSVMSLIKEINDRHTNKMIADAQEVMEYFTGVMRGDIKDQFGLEASLSERTRAAQELARRTVDWGGLSGDAEQPSNEIKITLNWDRG